MPKLRVRPASPVVTLALVLCAFAVPASAQEVLTEQVAIERALAREGIGELEAANRDMAAAGIAVVGLLDNPALEISRESVGGHSEWHLGVVQPIDLSGRRRALREAARSEAGAAESDIDWRRQELIAQVRRAYVSCAAAGAELTVWQAHAAQLAEAARIADARAQQGDTAVYDLRRTRVAASSANAELTMAQGARDADCIELASLTGSANPAVPPSAMTSLQSGGMVSDRPDLAAREQRIMAASQRVTAARRARLPQISIGAGVKRTSDGTGGAFGPTVSVGVTLPVFNGGRAHVSLAEAEARALQAELAIARRNIEAEQQASAVRAQAARNAAVEVAGSREDASRLGTIALTAYQAGEIGVAELLDAYGAQRGAELNVIHHARRAAEAAIAFELATGRNIP